MRNVGLIGAGNISDLQLANEVGLYEDVRVRWSRADAERVAAREELTRLMGLTGARVSWTLPEGLPEVPPAGNGPATYYRYEGAPGSIGFITPLSHNFCDRCNRVRLTARGHLRRCLFGDDEVDLRTPLRTGASDDEITERIRDAVRVKPERHHLELGAAASRLIALSQTGG